MVKAIKKFVQRVFNKAPDPFAGTTGREQLLIDPTRILAPNGTIYAWKQLSEFQRIWEFNRLAKCNPIACGAVNLICALVNTEVQFPDVSPETAKILRDVCERIDIEQVLYRLIWNCCVSGFAIGELCFDDNMDIDRIVVPSSQHIRAIVNQQGQVENWVQLNGFNVWANDTKFGQVVLPSSKTISITRNSDNSFSPYGSSILEAAREKLEEISILEQAQLSNAIRILRCVWLVLVNPEGLTKEEFMARLSMTRDLWEDMERGPDSKNLYLPAGVDGKPLTVEGGRFSDEVRQALNELCAAINIPGQLLNIGGAVSTNSAEALTRQQSNLCHGMLTNFGENICASFDRSLWKLVARIHDIEEPIKMKLAPSRLVDEKLQLEIEQLSTQLAIQDTAIGVRDFDWLAQRRGADKPADPVRMQKAIDAQTVAGSKAAGPDSTNTTKTTDIVATSNLGDSQ